MDHGHADKDLGVVVAFLLFPDVECPELALAGLEGRDLGGCRFADGRDYSGGSFPDGFFCASSSWMLLGLALGMVPSMRSPSPRRKRLSTANARYLVCYANVSRTATATTTATAAATAAETPTATAKARPPLAIVHVVMKSSSQAPPAAAHAQYISRDGLYERRGGLDLVESGNMPRFAERDPQLFWEAADTFERKNGRAYTELQIALPRELDPEQRVELARETTRDLMGDRFAYTLAIHTPLAKDNIEQPHLHLMFSERVLDERTRELSEEQFFKRNGARKDPEWNAREKPMEVRELWVERMNAAMERHGHIEDPAQRLDARSWADQGRHDLAELVEPKLLAGSEAEARALHAHVNTLREQRAELPEAHLAPEQAIEKIEQRAEQQIAEVREREAQELSRLDKLIAAAKEFAHEVKDRTVELAKQAKEWAGSLFGREPKEEHAQAGRQREQARPLTPEMAARLEELAAGFDRRMAAEDSLEAKLADFDRRMDQRLEAQDQALAPDKSLSQDEDRKHQHEQGFGIGM